MSTKSFYQPLDYAVVKVVSSEMVVAGGSVDFKNSVSELQDRNVESTATEVKNQDFLFDILLVQPIGKGGRCWFVDDPQDF